MNTDRKLAIFYSTLLLIIDTCGILAAITYSGEPGEAWLIFFDLSLFFGSMAGYMGSVLLWKRNESW